MTVKKKFIKNIKTITNCRVLSIKKPTTKVFLTLFLVINIVFKLMKVNAMGLLPSTYSHNNPIMQLNPTQSTNK